MVIKRIRAHVNPLSVIHQHSFEGFGNNNPVWVDVGAYKGEFTENLALKFPEVNFVVFEIRKPIADLLEKKFESFSNIRVFDGDAGINFRNILEPCMKQGAKIEKIFVNFPDPWFKDRHKKRRFISPRFINSCKEWLSSETDWVFQTDQAFLFEETKEVLNECKVSYEFFEDSPYGVQTDWEQAKMSKGEEIYRMKFEV